MDKSVEKSVAIRHAIGASLRPITERFTYRVRSGIAAGAKDQGWFRFFSVPSAREVLPGLNFQGKTVYDVGSYEGIFSLRG